MSQMTLTATLPPTVDPLALLPRWERELIECARRFRQNGKVGIIVVKWDGLAVQVYPTLPPERIET